jgi:hypothetical protein
MLKIEEIKSFQWVIKREKWGKEKGEGIGRDGKANA